MRKRAFLMLGLAVLFGAASVYLLRGWLDRHIPRATAPVRPQLAMIVVARAPLNFGTKLGPEHLQEVPWPAEAVPAGAFRSIADLLKPGESRVVLRSLERSEPVLEGKVSGPGGRAILSTVIDRDMRAMTIRVNDVLGVAGFVLPGDHVDVMLTRKDDKDNPSTDVLLQKIKVLGVDQEASDRKDKPLVARAVTLEVDPDQAAKLTLASQVGTLSLALRNQENVETARVRTVNVRDLKPVEKPAADDGRMSVRILRGTSISQVEVNPEGRAAPRLAPAGETSSGSGSATR